MVKFNGTTTLIEVLKHNLKDLERANILNLKKDVIVDLALYAINIQSPCNNLQENIKQAEELLSKRVDALEQSLINKIDVISKNPTHDNVASYKSLPENLKDSPGHTNTTKSLHQIVDCDHIQHSTENFIDEDAESELIETLEKLDFKQENGHGVFSYGEQYKYTNSKSEKPEEMPPLLKALRDELSRQFPEDSVPTQCLINRFEGPESFLPTHCDDEKTISPNSKIYTISLGTSSKIKYTNLHTGEQRNFHPNGRSLYVMTRKSQGIWSHGIEKSADFQGVRYSITFRTVGKQYNRSTVILGDSHTKYLKFGVGTGTFGYNMPGTRVFAPLIEQLDPQECIGYSNIIIHCGINNIKGHGVNVPNCVDRLICKVETIRALCPKSKITINPILPTKSQSLNDRCKHFNKLLNKLLLDFIDSTRDHQLHYLNFDVFVDLRSNLLRDDLGRFKNPHDPIHLGSEGVQLLVKLIKDRVCGSRVDGRPYAGVSSVNSGRVRAQHGVSSMNRGSTNRGRVQNDVRRADSVNRVGRESMMAAPITTSDEFPVLSQQLES